jgi:GNAT superfamily N-acetyltransferase
MKIEFKSYEEKDFEELSKMVFGFHAGDSCEEKLSTTRIKRTIEKLTSNPDRGKILLFFFEKAVVGYAIVICYWSNELGGEIIFIDELYVKPFFRKQGIGKQFIKYLVNCKEKDAKAIQLEVKPANKRVGKFYLKQGFHILSSKSLIREL